LVWTCLLSNPTPDLVWLSFSAYFCSATGCSEQPLLYVQMCVAICQYSVALGNHVILPYINAINSRMPRTFALRYAREMLPVDLGHMEFILSTVHRSNPHLLLF